MQAHASAYLHLMRAAVQATDAEVFAFATSLTRLTPILAHREVDVAIELASAAVDDRFGGTRIATNLRALLASRHGHDTRGAIVVIASDGWDADPPEALAAAMARLRRRAHRVVWLNPRAGAPGYEPSVAAMAAALPFIDDLLPAATLQDLVLAIEKHRDVPRNLQRCLSWGQTSAWKRSSCATSSPTGQSSTRWAPASRNLPSLSTTESTDPIPHRARSTSSGRWTTGARRSRSTRSVVAWSSARWNHHVASVLGKVAGSRSCSTSTSCSAVHDSASWGASML